jgi:hypothetical protein
MKAYQYGISRTRMAKRRNESACTLDELLDGADSLKRVKSTSSNGHLGS